MSGLAVAWAVLFIVHIICSGSSALVAYCLGADIEEIVIGVGPVMYRRGILRVSVLPFTAWVKFSNGSPDDVPAETPSKKHKDHDADLSNDKLPINGLSRWRRLLIMSSGLIIGFLISLLFLWDIGYAVDIVILGVCSLYEIICSPFSEAYELYDAAWNYVLAHPLYMSVAHALLFVVSIHIFPIPFTCCGNILFDLMNPGKKNNGMILLEVVLSWCVLLVMFLIFISLIAYVFS